MERAAKRRELNEGRKDEDMGRNLVLCQSLFFSYYSSRENTETKEQRCSDEKFQVQFIMVVRNFGYIFRRSDQRHAEDNLLGYHDDRSTKVDEDC
jgi:hypothetical protein